MLNYIKSECFRALHTKSVYVMNIFIILFFLFFNILLYFIGGDLRTTSASYSIVVENPMFLPLFHLVTGSILFEKILKFNTLKNTVSMGISRTAIFFGTCVVTILFTAVSMFLLLLTWIPTASILFPDSDPIATKVFLEAFLMTSLISVSYAIFSVSLFLFTSNSFLILCLFLSIHTVLPRGIRFLGMITKNRFLFHLSSWLPVIFFEEASRRAVNSKTCITAWSTAPGAAKCLLSGLILCLIFGSAGLLLFRKKKL